MQCHLLHSVIAYKNITAFKTLFCAKYFKRYAFQMEIFIFRSSLNNDNDTGCVNLNFKLIINKNIHWRYVQTKYVVKV